MILAPCPRRWEASALEDGRLSGVDRASFERHAGSCGGCRGELAELAALKRQLSLLAPATADPFTKHRARAELLRRANKQALQPYHGPRRRAFSAAVGLVLVAAAAGAARLHAQRGDGEALGAETIRPVPVPPAPALAAPDVSASALLAFPPAPRPAVLRAPSPKSTAPPPASAGIMFDNAVASFEAGAFEQADAELARFGRAYPEDSRSEDAAYLRAVAHSRMGDRAGAARLASDYLAAYPTGLRRLEAQRIGETAR